MKPFTKKAGMTGKNELIDRCDALYIWHKEPVYRMALSALSGDEEWALSVLESCMMTAYRYIDKFENENTDRTRAIMAAILQRVLSDLYQETWKKMGVPDEYESPMLTKRDELHINQILIRNELTADLAKHVEKLSRKERELVFFRFFLELPREELAEQLKLSPEEVDSRVLAVKQKIAKLMVEG